ncbi:MAG TPA: peptide chain release factor N(5)-glutamine methyltransferase [Steroidobacteraceae bacterium]|nr:peptide chain release factor N(5)-glutamine methyltransferase [Steroidobacteraceae bacterium]
MDGNLTVGALLARGTERLADAADPASLQLDAEVLLGCALGMSRAQIRSHPEAAPSDERVQRFERLIERRRAGEPVAYIVGHREFWSMQLAVGPAVLIPRPETELLVERALSVQRDSTGRVLDLGTGSGAVALALASQRPDWLVTATDLSDDALTMARANAAALGLNRVEFLRGSWFDALPGRRFDLVVSNPPYVAENDPALAAPGLKYEPRLALAAGADGLLCLRAIIRQAPQHLERRGWLLLEHGAGQATAVARELVVRGFGHVRSHRDLAGHERMTEAQWP